MYQDTLQRQQRQPAVTTLNTSTSTSKQQTRQSELSDREEKRQE